MTTTQGNITTADGVRIFYKKHSGVSDFAVVMVHGLFGNTEIFSKYENIFQKEGVNYVSFDLRGFGNSEIKNVCMKGFTEDLKSIVKQLLWGFKGNIFLVGYSMGSVVTSIAYETLKRDSRIHLIHISPVLFLRKRKILLNFPLSLGNRMDTKLFASPRSFVRVIWELLRNRNKTNVNDSVIFIGNSDFCFSGFIPNAKNIKLIKDNHYTLYRNPAILAELLVRECSQMPMKS